jgi:spermidine/putrescine transport system permease protein
MNRIPAAALPATLWWSVFFVAPFAGLALMSFGSPQTMPFIDDGAFAHLTTGNYVAAADPLYTSVLLATLRTAASGTLLCLLAGFPAAYVLARVIEPRWRPLLLILLMLPYWTSFLLRTIAWRILLAPDGPVSSAGLASGLLHGPLALLDTAQAVQIGIVYNYLPIAILPLYVALEKIPRNLHLASMDLGASRLVSFLTITMPLALPGIAGAALLTFVLAAGDYVVPALLGGARGLMLGSLIATQVLAAQNLPLGSAIALMLLGALALTVFAVWVMARTLIALPRALRRSDAP